MKPTVQRFEEVDGLRAVACALVVWHHVAAEFAAIAGSGQWARALAERWNFGWIGVLAFFAISGYVVPHSLRGPRGAGLRRFALRRGWRLYPPFWLALLATWLAAPAKFTAAQVGWNATMLPSLAGQALAAGHFWTLEIELAFYALLVALFAAVGRLGWPVLAAAFVLVAGAYTEWAGLPLPEHWFWLLLFLAIMLWGAVCREIMRADFGAWCGPRRAGLARAVALGLATGLVALRPLKSAYFGWIEGNTSLMTFGLNTSFALLLFLFWVVLRPVRSARLARWGRWTYSTYLLHAVVFYGVLHLITRLGIGWLQGWPLPLYVAAMIVLCFAVGGLAFRWIEQPSDRLGHRLASRPPSPPAR